MKDVFEWLQNWFKSQCDGDWEHEYGVKIETVDNPGWYVVINLTGTECEGCAFPGATFCTSYRGRFGETIEISSPDGRGIVYDSKGNFLFFKE